MDHIYLLLAGDSSDLTDVTVRPFRTREALTDALVVQSEFLRLTDADEGIVPFTREALERMWDGSDGYQILNEMEEVDCVIRRVAW